MRDFPPVEQQTFQYGRRSCKGMLKSYLFDNGRLGEFGGIWLRFSIEGLRRHLIAGVPIHLHWVYSDGRHFDGL